MAKKPDGCFKLSNPKSTSLDGHISGAMGKFPPPKKKNSQVLENDQNLQMQLHRDGYSPEQFLEINIQKLAKKSVHIGPQMVKNKSHTL